MSQYLIAACVFSTLVLAPGRVTAQSPSFTDVTGAAGILHVHHDVWNPPDPEMSGYIAGGAAAETTTATAVSTSSSPVWMIQGSCIGTSAMGPSRT